MTRRTWSCARMSGEVARPAGVAEVPVAGCEPRGEVVRSVGLHRHRSGDRHPAFAFAHRRGDDERGARILPQLADLRGVRPGEELHGAVVGDLEPHRARLGWARPGSHRQEAVQRASEELAVLGGQRIGAHRRHAPVTAVRST